MKSTLKMTLLRRHQRNDQLIIMVLEEVNLNGASKQTLLKM